MRLRSGIRCDVVCVVVAALLTVLAFAQTAAAAPPTETPADLHVTQVDARVIAVAWSPSADASLVPELTVATAGHPETAHVRVLAENSTAWAEGVRCGESVTFTVVLRNADGEAGPPATVTQAADPCDPGPPPPPSSVAPSSIAGGAVGIGWDPPIANDVSVAELTVNGPDGFTTTQQISFFDPGGLVSGLTCGTAYSFAVTFLDSDGLRSEPATTSAETKACDSLGPAPDALTGLRTVWITPAAVLLAWDTLPTGVVDVVVAMGEQSGSRKTRLGQRNEAGVLLAACGQHLATVTALYSDGRVSKPATVSFKSPCPPPAITVTHGPVPWRRATITVRRQGTVKVTRDGRFVLPGDTVRCPAVGGSCRVTVRVEARIPGKRGPGPLLTLGAVETTLTPRFLRTVTGRLSPGGRAALRRLGRLRVSVEIEVWHVAGLNAVTTHPTFVPARR